MNLILYLSDLILPFVVFYIVAAGLLAGRPEDFNVDVECSVGSVTVGGSTWAGLFMDQEAGSGNRSKEMELSCEAGSIDLDFFEEE